MTWADVAARLDRRTAEILARGDADELASLCAAWTQVERLRAHPRWGQ